MFEHLPEITRDNLNVLIDKEISCFASLLKRCIEETDTPDGAIDCMCQELNNSNPHLVNAVRASAYSVASELEGDVPRGYEWRAGLATVPGVLAILRLIDRALEARVIMMKLGLYRHK